MLTAGADDFIRCNLETTAYMGTRDRCLAVVEALFADALFAPEKWDTRERPRRLLDRTQLEELIAEWTKRHRWRLICFGRTKPVRMLVTVNIRRFKNARFNSVDVYLHEKYLVQDPAGSRLVALMRNLAAAVSADYGYIAHERQRRPKSRPGTPAERLEGVFWTNYLGARYLEFFGRESVLASPDAQVTEISPDLVELKVGDLDPAAGRSSETLDRQRAVARHLNRNAFAEINATGPLSAPVFDFSQLDPELNPD